MSLTLEAPAAYARQADHSVLTVIDSRWNAERRPPRRPPARDAGDQPTAYGPQAGPLVDTTAAASGFVGETKKGWLRVAREMMKFAALEDNWDGLGADAPPMGSLGTAFSLASALKQRGYPLPDRVAPTPAGTIMFVWRDGPDYMEIEVTSPGLAEWMTVDATGVARHGVIPGYDAGVETND